MGRAPGIILVIVLLVLAIPVRTKAENEGFHFMLGLFGSVAGHMVAQKGLKVENRGFLITISLATGMAPNIAKEMRDYYHDNYSVEASDLIWAGVGSTVGTIVIGKIFYKSNEKKNSQLPFQVFMNELPKQVHNAIVLENVVIKDNIRFGDETLSIEDIVVEKGTRLKVSDYNGWWWKASNQTLGIDGYVEKEHLLLMD